MRHGYTAPTGDVRAWLDEEFPERDVYVQHSPACDLQSYGDACVGGCLVLDVEEATA